MNKACELCMCFALESLLYVFEAANLHFLCNILYLPIQEVNPLPVYYKMYPSRYHG